MRGEQLARAALVVAVAVVAAVAATWLSSATLRRLARGRYAALLMTLYRTCRRPWGAVLLLTALLLAVPATGVSGDLLSIVRNVLLVAWICAVAWFVTGVLFVAEEITFRRLPMDIADNRRTRRVRTQIGLLRRLTALVVVVFAVAFALMTFAPLRAVGASLLVSAGIAGIIVGLAAQTTLGHVFAGLQLAFSDSLRLDDVVEVEGEWGRVEEIRLTQVVLRRWDHRRLILPTTYFTTTPFENWTRHEAPVLAEIILHVDYTAPVVELRTEARRVIEASPLWDQKEWTVQVVDSTPSTMVVRVLASAADAPSAWDLKCEVREALIDFMRDHHPAGLPRIRAEVDANPNGVRAGSEGG
jgi:small-conductance mechanosensitive channel